MYQGITKIELTDVKTQAKEVVEERNLVTQAISDLLRLNPSAMFYNLEGPRALWTDHIFPIASKSLGGLLCFEKRLEENPQNYIVPSDNLITAYASNNVNSTDNPKRGSLNLAESKALKNGYQFVWDFTTSQGNGRIAALSLTHYLAGLGFYGDSYNGENANLLMARTNAKQTERTVVNYYIGLVEIDPIQNIGIAILLKGEDQLDIVTIRIPFTQIGIKDDFTDVPFQLVQERTVNIQGFFKNVRSRNNYSFHDGQDGYWYGFTSESDSSNNKTIFNRVKIDKNSLSATVDHWELPDVLLNVTGTLYTSTSGLNSRKIFSILKTPYLYGFHQDRQAIIKINVNNPVDVSLIESSFSLKYGSGKQTDNYFYAWGDYLKGENFLLDRQDRLMQTKENLLQDIATPVFTIGPYRMGYSSYIHYSNVYFNHTVYLHTPYLGTINNLATPVVKTADKTMKITYTLTEMEE